MYWAACTYFCVEKKTLQHQHCKVNFGHILGKGEQASHRKPVQRDGAVRESFAFCVNISLFYFIVQLCIASLFYSLCCSKHKKSSWSPGLINGGHHTPPPQYTTTIQTGWVSSPTRTNNHHHTKSDEDVLYICKQISICEE